MFPRESNSSNLRGADGVGKFLRSQRDGDGLDLHSLLFEFSEDFGRKVEAGSGGGGIANLLGKDGLDRSRSSGLSRVDVRWSGMSIFVDDKRGEIFVLERNEG